ncbi:MAG: 3'(2'),5'-bisphosphate nucleotidase [Epulopiscium sp. Nuni2H_MBin001]|nr:MAG: 3'(2'),5'-bisphosphate nucleotidase [Epulopiscium sp. Nuni2H_MBin001]
MDIKQIEQICCEIAVKAGEAIMEIYNMPQQIEYKSDNTPLTQADKISNEIITQALAEKYPEYAILTEEGRDDKTRLANENCFIVDPLDGTKEFIKRNGQFTVNIALAQNNKTILGVIYVPVTKELYFATKRNGSYYKEVRKPAQKITVSDETDLTKVRVVMSSSHGCEQMEQLIEKYDLTNLVKMGSSLKGCLIAKGDAEIYYRHNPTMEWDTAAMQCIVEEAGGIFRQMDGTKMTYNRENSLNDKGFYIVNNKKNII